MLPFKQLATGEAMWAKHHMVLGPNDPKTEKEEPDC